MNNMFPFLVRIVVRNRDSRSTVLFLQLVLQDLRGAVYKIFFFRDPEDCVPYQGNLKTVL